MTSFAAAYGGIGSNMTTVVASLGETPSEARIAEMEGRADLFEIRADLVDNGVALALAERFGADLIYTLRSHQQGGRWEGDAVERRQRLSEAASCGSLVDLELDRDDDPDTLGAVPEGQRLWSWHGRFAGEQRLRGRLSAMTALGGRYFKLVPTAGSQEDVIGVLVWLADQTDDVIAFAGGAAAGWGRVLASRLGAGWVYLSAGEPTAPGQLSLDRWFADGYADAPESPGRICGIVGSPVAHSLSPRVHNTAYRALGLSYLYLPFEVPDFADFWLEVVESESWPELGCELTGMSVTAPHKRVALAVAGASSPLSAYVGAANTLVKNRGVWEAEITDPDGVRLPLEAKNVELRGTTAAVIGAGGAGRGAVVALRQAGAEVVVVNRSAERGRRVAERFEVPFVPLGDFRPADYRIIVHATSVGRDGSEPPFSIDGLHPDGCVVDMVYRDPVGEVESAGETALVRRARERGLCVVDGREVLLAQALLQFRMMTGEELPVTAARRELGLPDLP